METASGYLKKQFVKMITIPIKIMTDTSSGFCDRLTQKNRNGSADGKQTSMFFKFKIKSSTDQITKTIQKFDQLLDDHNCCSSRTKSELSTALSEALANAIIHGNHIDSKKFVDLKIYIYQDKMVLSIKDKGKGFDLKKLPDPLKSENIKKPSGRGVYLMSVLVDEVEFIQHKNGMEVVLTKYLQKNNPN